MSRIATGLVTMLLIASLVRADAPATPPAVYDETADPKADVAAAVARAAKSDKRVLLEIGGNWCHWCIMLHDLFHSDPEIAAVLKAEYEIVYVNYSTKQPNKEFMELYHLHPGSYPFLVVIDSENKVLVQQQTEPLEDGPKHDPKKVKAFLEKWKTPRSK